MNTYRKYCPNVFVAQCTEQHQKGDIITIETKLYIPSKNVKQFISDYSK